MKSKFFLFISLLIFLIIFFIFYKGLQKSNIYKPSVELNNKIPEYSSSLLDLDREINYSDIFKSENYYLLNIWSSWCVPCREEHYILITLAQQKNLKVIGINYKDNKEKAKNFLQELGNPYEKIIFDKNGINAIEWGAYGVPESFLIYNGKIIKKYIGPLKKESIIEILALIK